MFLKEMASCKERSGGGCVEGRWDNDQSAAELSGVCGDV